MLERLFLLFCANIEKKNDKLGKKVLFLHTN